MRFEITMHNEFCITEEDILYAIVNCIGVDEDDFPDDELVEVDIMTCDDDGNICEGPKSHVCYMCRTLIVAVGIENQS